MLKGYVIFQKNKKKEKKKGLGDEYFDIRDVVFLKLSNKFSIFKKRNLTHEILAHF